jgi:hypothetical protein
MKPPARKSSRGLLVVGRWPGSVKSPGVISSHAGNFVSGISWFVTIAMRLWQRTLNCNRAGQKGADAQAAAISSPRERKLSRMRTFLAELGIEANKEGEAIYYGPVEGSSHFYGGWFYFVGELIEAGERFTTIALPGSPRPVLLLPGPGEGFQYWFSTSFARPPAIFGSRVRAVEFTTLIPWVLDEPHSRNRWRRPKRL